MWPKKGASLSAVLLIAVCLVGCKTDDDSSSSATAAGTVVSPSADAPFWKGRPLVLAPRASDGISPSDSQPQQARGSQQQQVNSRVSQQPDTQAVRDPSAAQAAESLVSVSKPGSLAYRIGPLDVLDISVFQAPDLSKTVEVADNGTIDLPLLGETPAAGKTAQELQRELNSKLGAKYLQNPQTTVKVKEFNSNRVTVSGAVKNPGVFPYKGETLLQFVTMAGGLAPESNSMVLVLRQDNGRRSAAKFNIGDIQTGNVSDPPMQSGDVIVADTSVMKKGLNGILKVLPLAGFAALL
jgi:polysaccharide export outer membrane protein